MKWDDLRFVLAVGRQGTLAAAGRELGVDATTVGRRITLIEEELAARLFDRNQNGFTPTHTGELAVARAAEVERHAVALEREVYGSAARIEGPVRITALDAFFDSFLIPRLPPLLRSHPGLELTLMSGTRTFDLTRLEADIAIRNGAPTDPDLVGRRLGTASCGLYVARDTEIDEEPRLIGLPAKSEFNDAMWFRDHFPTGRIVIRANTEQHMFALARAGIGIAMADCHLGDPDPQLRRAVKEPIMNMEIWAVVHRDMRHAPRVKAVLDFLTDIVAGEQDLLNGTACHHD